ncbi:MAG: hypothetical protein KBD53_09140 [Candidatus Omnitrophica bacterium]|nr:hypothetical protein [Candidatus Omnitrophota bacterium]
MLKKSLYVLTVFFLSGCTVFHQTEKPHTITPPSFANEKKQVVPDAIELSTQGTLQAETMEPIEEKGVVFAKTLFQGVLKTSYVQLKFVDLKNPIRSYELLIGERIAAQPFSFNVRTVRPGYFYIELPAGKYQITSVSIPVGGTTATEPINIIFEVIPNEISYLGTLYLNGTKERIKLGGVPVIKPGFEYQVLVLDELPDGVRSFKQRFPNISGEITRRLMTVHK